MKIKSLNIASFGGLKNLQISLESNFNVIYGNNENGKTTIMNFIKMMFYGTDRGSAQISKNLRKKYTPWDNGTMAGSIDFENQNRNWRIERIFGSSNSTDKVTLIDLDLGTRESVSADIGNKLFGLSYQAFERSVFVGQFGFPESNAIAEGEINSKLSNLTLTGDQSVSFDEVNKRLSDAKGHLTTKRSVGAYDKNLAKLQELNQKLELANQMQSTLSSKQQLLDETHKKIEELQKAAQELKAKISSEQDFKNAEKLKELLSLKDKLDQLNQSLKLENGQLIDEMFLRKIQFSLSKIETTQQKIDSKQKEIELLQNNLELALNPSPDMTPEKAEELKLKISNYEKEKQEIDSQILTLESVKKPNNIPFIITLIIGIVFTALGVAISGVIPSVCGVVLMVLSIILQVSSKAKQTAKDKKLLDLKLKQNQLISVIATEKANLNAVNTAINSNSTIIEKQKEMLESSKNELDSLQNEKETDTISLIELYSRYRKTADISEIKNSLDDIQKLALSQKELKQNINYILKDVGNISYDEARLKLENLPDRQDNIDFEELKNQYEAVNQELNSQTSIFASTNTEIKAIKENIANIESLKTKLSSLKETLKNQKEYCDAIDIASSVLADSFVEVRRSFGSVLEKMASDIFKGITGGRYNSMSISKSFDIAVEKTDVFGTKEIDYLSSGTADQAYLSLRLAVCELMAQDDNRLPVLLDDALAQYDDERTKTALEFLKNYSTDGQIILFTCHNSVKSLAKASGANEIML